MRIAVTSDIHYDLIASPAERRGFSRFLAALAGERADALIIAGDLVGLGWAMLTECLERFAPVSPVRLMVFGNHDHWCTDRRSPAHLEKLAAMVTCSGFHLLDAGPFLFNGVGFAGNSLWYDYSLAAGPAGPGNDYEGKIFSGRLAWNDAQFVKLDKNDGEYASELLSRLERDIAGLEGQSERIVAVTHHVGFAELLSSVADEPELNFRNAYMGSRRLGKLLLSHPKVKVHVCGHSHRPARLHIDGLEVINPGSSYDEKKYSLFEIGCPPLPPPP
jgi:predicted phosphodiesterase